MENPNLKLIELQRKAALLQKQNELLRTKIEQKYINTTPTDEELQQHIDPNDPQAVVRFANEYAKKAKDEITTLFNEVDQEAQSYIQKQYSDDEVKLQTELAKYVAAKNSDLSYEQLTKDTPARLLEEFKEGKLPTYEALFEAVEQYHANLSTHNPTPPPQQQGATQPPTDIQQQAPQQQEGGITDDIL